MFNFLSELLSDKTGGVIFRCFDIWHICFIVFFVALGILLCLYLKNKDCEKREKIINAVVAVAFGLYVADFLKKCLTNPDACANISELQPNRSM